MSRLLRHPVLFVRLGLISATLVAPAHVLMSEKPAAQAPVQDPSSGSLTRVLPAVTPTHRAVPSRIGPVGFATSAGPHLTYFGGPVISNVQVVEVLYGSGSYDPQVAGVTSPTIGNFYTDITGSNSGLTTLLSQYDTTIAGGTNQTIGNGTFGGLFQISPSTGNDGSTIGDPQIQAELLAQINAAHLPAPMLDAAGNVNTVYMIYFPPGKTITLNGAISCGAGSFCAYHGTTASTLNGKNILYGVFPDFQPPSGCSQGCGTSTTFGNYTSVSTHELAEAITDPDSGIATTVASPLAWDDMSNGMEIGDLCEGQQDSYTANGTTYTIQLLFSNSASSCVLPPPSSLPDFSLSASPSSVSLTPGNSGNSTITVNAVNGFTGSVSLSASGLPSGVTATLNPTGTMGTSKLTLNAGSTAATGQAAVTVTGTSGSLTHTTRIILTISAAPDYSLSASPASLAIAQGNSGSTIITVIPLNSFTGSVSLSASGLPSGVTASFNPPSTTSTSTLTLTASSTASLVGGVPNPQNASFARSTRGEWSILFAAIIAGVLVVAVQTPKHAPPVILGMLLIGGMLSCGGGSRPTPSPTPTPTPSTNAAVVVDGTIGGVSRTVSLTLTVTH